MSITMDTVISSTQTLYDNNQKLVLIFDKNQKSYELLAWHSCQTSNQQLIILIKENNNENGWLGTLTTILKENQVLIWKNHLNHHQYQLYLSEKEDSLITHFEIQDTPNLLLILYTSSSYIILNSSFLSSQIQPINNHFITLKEINGIIYYLSDVFYTNSSNELLVFILNQSNHYELHHIYLKEKNLFENHEEIQFEHCCCLNNNSKFISCSHFLSFINISCEIEQDNQTNIHLIDLDNNRFVHWTN